MHIFFSGIGGTAIGPLALIAKQAGHTVSGSDRQESYYTDYLRSEGVSFYIGQTTEQITAEHAKHPIDWLVYSSAVSRGDPNHPEIAFAKANGIRHGKRDELLNQIIHEHDQKLLAVAGTHGKTTTTAMLVWLLKQVGAPMSYSVGTKLSFGPMGTFDPNSDYFVYECDEFDRNFLAFHPYLSLITGIAWDHHEIFPTFDNYKQAFREFIDQSEKTIVWQEDAQTLALPASESHTIIDEHDPTIAKIRLAGEVNRQDAWQVMQAVHALTNTPIDQLIGHMNDFPGIKQRMERLAPSVYTNYAHTPEKIKGGMDAALEIARANNQDVIVVYEPLTNRRQHYIKDDYKDCFNGAKKVYWLPTYLAREDPSQKILTPQELITHLSDPTMAEASPRDDTLLAKLKDHLAHGDMVVAMAPSGAESLDEWLRHHAGELSA